jgi:hypothetical protein
MYCRTQRATVDALGLATASRVVRVGGVVVALLGSPCRHAPGSLYCPAQDLTPAAIRSPYLAVVPFRRSCVVLVVHPSPSDICHGRHPLSSR